MQSVTNLAGLGVGKGWTNANFITADDGQRANCSVLDDATAQPLRATGFDFDLPADAVVRGIRVDIKRSAKGRVHPTVVGLLPYGSDKTDGESWPRVGLDSVKSYGGDSDLWCAVWPIEDINAPDFGVSIEPAGSIGVTTILVDYVSITIYYE